MFYTNVQQRGNRIYMRGIDMGMRVKDVIEYKPYMFMLKNGGAYKTINGKEADRIDFDSISEARDFQKRYADVSNMEIFGLTSWAYTYIYDKFKGEINYNPDHVKVGILDIECKADDGFPNIQKADKEITAITIRVQGRNYVYGCGDFVNDDPLTTYVKCKDEEDLLQRFLTVWEKLDFDVLTGWNIEFFDIPYIVNRIRLLFGEAEAKRLSPWRILEEKELEIRGQKNQTYVPMGIAILDYYQLYKKFTYTSQESYKLDYIAKVELEEQKVDYSEYGSLLELYKNNYQKFIEYNIHDCVLVERLDDKMKLIEQVMALAYDAKVNYNDTLTTVRQWDVIIHNYLMDQNIVIPQFKFRGMEQALVGGHVKDPKIGLSKWVVSFDLNSLYPHLIMMYNISPDTFWHRIHAHEFPSIKELLQGRFDYKSVGANDAAVAANGCMFFKHKQGFLPALMEKMYNDRTVYKKKMIEAKKAYEISKSYDDQKLISKYHNLQLSKKIQLNSAYGALGNEYFRWFEFNYAEAITVSGQFTIQWIEKKMNEFMNKLLKTDGVDYVIASDTDSIYITFEKLVETLGDIPEIDIVRVIDQFCNDKIQPYMDKCYEELGAYMNCYQQKMQMKRETIANKGIWRKKKMYILNAWNV
jgi:DNA polymerase elongation subunit (family B)